MALTGSAAGRRASSALPMPGGIRLLPAFSKSPFKKDEENEENPVPEMIEENEASPLNDASAPSNHQSRISEAHSTVSVKRFETYPSENKWTDLLLDIAMTTAFDSLSNNVRILEITDVLSYIAFFLLVWWIYASQIAYDLRYRKTDCVHLLFAFIQFVIFCGMAAFAGNFDITAGLSGEKAEQSAEQLVLNITTPNNIQDVEAEYVQKQRLVVLNARGISVVMGLSRLLLLLEYSVALGHATKEVVMRQTGSKRTCCRVLEAQRDVISFHIQIISALLQAICFFLAHKIIGGDIASVTRGDQIAKIVLWYLPLLIEFVFHLYHLKHAGSTLFKSSKVFERSACTFTVVIGGGLDNITQGFQYIVGNSTIGVNILGALMSASVIFIVQFIIYFGTEADHVRDGKDHRRRNFAWTTVHLFYVSTLIVLLRAIASLLTSVDIVYSLQIPTRFIEQSESLLLQFGANATLYESAFQTGHNISHECEDFGLAFQDYLNQANMGLANSSGLINGTIGENPFTNNAAFMTSQVAVLQAGMSMVEAILDSFNAGPEEGSLLEARINAFTSANTSDFMHANATVFVDIFHQAILLNASPILWFYSSGGLTIILLGILRAIKQWPLEMYDWALLHCRVIFGLGITLLAILDIGSLTNVADIEDQGELSFADSPVWRLLDTSWTLPVFAVALIVEQIVELLILCISSSKKPSASSYGRPKIKSSLEINEIKSNSDV